MNKMQNKKSDRNKTKVKQFQRSM